MAPMKSVGGNGLSELVGNCVIGKNNSIVYLTNY